MSSNKEAVNGLLSGVQYLIDNAIKKAPFDKIRTGRIKQIKSNGTYDVIVDGNTITDVKSIGNSTLPVNTTVKVVLPENQANNMFILGTSESSSTVDGVSSVNGKTGNVVIGITDIANLSTELASKLTEETDPTVPEWAKTPTKPAYTAADVGAAETNHTHTGYASSTHNHTKSEITDFPALLSLGETSSTAYVGDKGKTAYDHSQTDHAPSDATANDTDANLKNRANHTGEQAISTVTGLQTALDGKQPNLVSGTNIKTINGTSLLGSGNITIEGGGSSTTEIAIINAPADTDTFEYTTAEKEAICATLASAIDFDNVVATKLIVLNFLGAYCLPSYIVINVDGEQNFVHLTFKFNYMDSINIGFTITAVDVNTNILLSSLEFSYNILPIPESTDINKIPYVTDGQDYALKALAISDVTDLQTNLDGKASKSTIVSATLSAASWTGASAPFSYALSVTGVTATSNQEVLPSASITAEQLTALQAANIQDGGQSAGSVTLKAFGEKPTIDIPIRIILRGDA